MASIKFLNQQEAKTIDERLMGDLGFCVEQLMELAGLAVAQAVESHYSARPARPRVLVLAGPGNNGGDGLVAARHLHFFRFPVCVYYPKPTPRPLFEGLTQQCRVLQIPFLESTPSLEEMDSFDVVLDALFGFSFKPPVRPPFDMLIQHMCRTKAEIVSIDIPSGWDVEKGPSADGCFTPAVLVSLTAPKECARHFKGEHFLGGRFVPKVLSDEYALCLPEFPGSQQFLRLA